MVLRVVARQTPAEGVVSVTLARQCGGELPPWAPGAHIDLTLGADRVRQYSLCGPRDNAHCYTVAVRVDPEGRGGSRAMAQLRRGDTVEVAGPRNNFTLVRAQHYRFIAGGIGITPILPMIDEVSSAGRSWSLVYGGRSRVSMPFVAELVEGHPGCVDVWAGDERGRIDLSSALRGLTPSTAVYCCGPEPLLEAVEERCRRSPAVVLHMERFRPRPEAGSVDRAFHVKLARSGRALHVPAGKSLLSALLEEGIDVPFSCQEGTCGTCETPVVAGEVDHRDSILSETERATNLSMMVCVSRALGDRLVIDC